MDITFEDRAVDIKGKYYLKRYKHIPMEEVIKRYYNGAKGELEIFFNQNKDEIFERAKSTYQLPTEDIFNDCIKRKYISKVIANYEMRLIQSHITGDYKPIRSYYCEHCSHWHLTSHTNDIIEKYEINEPSK